MYRLQQIAIALSICARYQKNLTNAHITVFAGLNQVSAGLNLMCGINRFLPAETQPWF